MPKVAFYRRLSPDDRAQLDAEIRRRGYGDSVGVCAWLADRGVLIRKSVLAEYARKLKQRDELVTAPFTPETLRALADFAHLAWQAKAAFDQLLLTLEARP